MADQDPVARFCDKARAALRADPGYSGQDEVRELLSAAVKDPAFVKALFPEVENPQERVAYEDPELGFQLLAHQRPACPPQPPHDHGESWAIYAQATGTSIMTVYETLPNEPDRVREIDRYELGPGEAALYTNGVIHGVYRPEPMLVVRFTGTDVNKKPRRKWTRPPEPGQAAE